MEAKIDLIHCNSYLKYQQIVDIYAQKKEATLSVHFSFLFSTVYYLSGMIKHLIVSLIFWTYQKLLSTALRW